MILLVSNGKHFLESYIFSKNEFKCIIQFLFFIHLGIQVAIDKSEKDNYSPSKLFFDFLEESKEENPQKEFKNALLDACQKMLDFSEENNTETISSFLIIG